MRLGTIATDKITGFSGVVLGYVQYISGCNQALLAPKVGADGSLRESQWFDVQRLAVDASAPILVLDNGDTPCFDRSAPKI